MGNNIKVTSYCAPKITIENVLKGDDGWHNHKNVSEVNLCWKENDFLSPGLKGVVFKTMQLTSTIRQSMHIANCPFDMQEFNINFQMPESASRDANDHNRYFVPLNGNVDFDTAADMWSYHRVVMHTTRPIGEKQDMFCIIRASRNSWIILVRLMSPVLM